MYSERSISSASARTFMPRFMRGVNACPSKVRSGVTKSSRSGETWAVPVLSATPVTIFRPTHRPDRRDIW